jgi:hypothetical protein
VCITHHGLFSMVRSWQNRKGVQNGPNTPLEFYRISSQRGWIWQQIKWLTSRPLSTAQLENCTAVIWGKQISAADRNRKKISQWHAKWHASTPCGMEVFRWGPRTSSPSALPRRTECHVLSRAGRKKGNIFGNQQHMAMGHNPSTLVNPTIAGVYII